MASAWLEGQHARDFFAVRRPAFDCESSESSRWLLAGGSFIVLVISWLIGVHISELVVINVVGKTSGHFDV